MPKKIKNKLPKLPDNEAIKKLFPKKVLEQVRSVVGGEKKAHK